MSYTITNSSNTREITVNDGAKDTSSTSLTLIGKNTTGYGIDLNTNFYKLLENFANSDEPENPISGQLWFDISVNTLKVYANANASWKNIGTVTAQATQPSNPISGDTWFDTVTQSLKVYNGTTFVLVGPQTAEATGITATTVLESTELRPVTIINSGGSNIALFTNVNITTSVDGFNNNVAQTFVKGLTVEGNIKADFFTGTAANATLFNGESASYYATVAQLEAATGVSPTGQFDSIVKITTGNAGVNSGNIGQLDNTFGNIHAQFYVGRATEAQYADLAERFSADSSYEAGTLVRIGGVNEITQENEELSEEVLGVISTNPAYLMNSSAGDNDTHPPIVIGGRTPVKVIGKVAKGQRLVSAGNGIARGGFASEINAFNVIGRSLEDKNNDSIYTIMAIIKINI